MTDDLALWQRIVNAERDEAKSRWAAALSIAAIVMLLITSVTVANFNAAPPVLSTTLLPLEPEAVAPYVPANGCLKLYRGQWLSTELKHSGDVEKLRVECFYGYGKKWEAM